MKKKFLTLFLSCSIFFSHAQTQQNIDYLKTFTKLYGYVRYFHPSDEAANLDWDKFAIYGVGEINKCNTAQQLQETLERLFKPIAPAVSIYRSGEKFEFDLNSITPLDKKKYMTTYWQHRGVDIGMLYHTEIYKSVRLNRLSHGAVEASSFGNVMSYISATQLRGKPIRFSGKVKLTNGSGGTGHLWLRVDKEDSEMGFFDNMGDRPILSSEWAEYTIEGTVDSAASGIAYGCFLLGGGELLFDDAKMWVMEKDSWVAVKIRNSDFELEGLSDDAANNAWTHRGKGYTIYRSRKVAFQGEWCVAIEKLKGPEVLIEKKIFDYEPKIGEIVNEDLGNEISCAFPLVLYCDKEHTYPKAQAAGLDSLISTVSYNEMNLSLRLADILITWNVFQHFYPYFDVVQVEWENELETSLRRCYRDTGVADFKVTLQKFTAPLKDGHIWVTGAGGHYFVPPIRWENVEGKLILTEICSKNIPLKIGDVVTEIDGIPTELYFRETESRISAATPGRLAYTASQESLYGEKDSEIAIVVNGSPHKLLRTDIFVPKNCPETNAIGAKDFAFLDSGLIYLNIDRIKMSVIDSLMPELQKANAIICDLRGYPNSNHDFITHLLKKKDRHNEWMQIPHIVYPNQKRIAGYEKHGWQMRPKKPYLEAKIVFIINSQAISYAESFMGFISGYNLATIVGQPTAGTNGNINPFVLPGGFKISWTGMKVIKHNGSQLHGVGILPHVPVSKTIKGVTEGRDEFLEKAIEIAKKN